MATARGRACRCLTGVMWGPRSSARSTAGRIATRAHTRRRDAPPTEVDETLLGILNHARHQADNSAVSVVANVTAVDWVLGAAGGLGTACLAWIIGGAVRASVRTTASARRAVLLLDELFDGSQELVTYRPGAGRSVDATPAVIIAGATNRGYRFVAATHHGGRTSMEFQRLQLAGSGNA